MDDQLYFEAQEPTHLIGGSGRAMQPQVPNTVGAGLNPYAQNLLPLVVPKEVTKTHDEDWLATDPAYYRGFIPQPTPAKDEGAQCATRGDCKHGSLDCVSGRCVPQTCGPKTPCEDVITSVCTQLNNSGQMACKPKQYEAGLPPLLASTLSQKTNASNIPENPAARATWQESQPFYRFLMRGQDRFGIYCAPCHGENGGTEGDTGSGTGIVKLRKPSWNIANYHTDERRAFPLGRIFDTISAGRGTMPGFASQIPVRDRWAIALYVRALQRSHYLESDKISQIQP